MVASTVGAFALTLVRCPVSKGDVRHWVMPNRCEVVDHAAVGVEISP